MSKRRGNVSQGKARRLAVGATVGGVLLIIFLAVILVVQFVQIGVKNAKIQNLQEEIERYTEDVDDAKKDLDWYKQGNGLYWHARTNGWT